MFFIRFSKSATPEELEERKAATISFLGFWEASASDSESVENGHCQDLPADVLGYLHLIAATEGLASSERDVRNRIFPKKGVALRRRLLDLELIREKDSKSPGPGRPRKDFIVTDAGRKTIGRIREKNGFPDAVGK
jgi:hypothetical protein